MDATPSPLNTYYEVNDTPCGCRLGVFNTHERAENYAKEAQFNVITITKHVVFKTREEANELASKHLGSHVYPEYSYRDRNLWRCAVRVWPITFC